jgi:hypothetical protein
LAVVSQPFTTEELKTLAHTLREISVQNERGGKISTQDWGSLAYFPSTGEAKSVPYIFGPFLDLPNPDLSRVLYRFPRLVLAAGFITTEDKERLPSLNLPKAPGFFFRAGMVANMVFSPLSSGAPGYSFAWQIGTPVWMPAYKVHHSLGI